MSDRLKLFFRLDPIDFEDLFKEKKKRKKSDDK